MKLIAYLILTICLVVISNPLRAQDHAGRDSIEAGVRRILDAYPKATLQDIYKSFFQDNYGPGHLVGDTAAAASYIRRELDSFDRANGPDFEATGSESNFVRVNLQVVKSGRVPLPTFLSAFMRSAERFEVPPVELWSKKWEGIYEVIESMNLNLPNQDVDSERIRKQLNEGNPTMHHSRIYDATYSPHYRIILREIFESELLPKL